MSILRLLKKSSRSSSSSLKNVCPFYKRSHKLSKCEESVSLRMSRIYSKCGCCFKSVEKDPKSKDCPSSEKCCVDNCGSKDSHHTLLHKHKIADTRPTVGEPARNTATITLLAAVDEPNEGRELARPHVMTLPVLIKADLKTAQTHSVLGSGSEMTFGEKRLADELGLRGPMKSKSVKPFSTETRTEPGKGMEVTLTVSSVDGKNVTSWWKAMTVDQLPFKPDLIPKHGKLI